MSGQQGNPRELLKCNAWHKSASKHWESSSKANLYLTDFYPSCSVNMQDYKGINKYITKMIKNNNEACMLLQ